MILLDRYIVRGIAQAAAVVALASAALALVVGFIGEVDSLGEGDYGLWQLSQYVLLSLPDDLHLAFPVIALLGALIALGGLAAGRELVVMRTAGVSVARLAGSVLLAGCLLAACSLLLGEFLGPRGVAIGDDLRDIARHGQRQSRADESLWLRDGRNYVRIGGVLATDRLVDVTLYRRDASGRLAEVAHAAGAELGDGGWRLQDAVVTRFGESAVKLMHRDRLALVIGLQPDMLEVSITKPDELATFGLYRYVRYLESNGVAAGEYRLAMWRNLVNPVTVLVLILFALPFAFGSLRGVGAGQRLFVGGMVGLVFFMFNEIGIAGGQVAGLPSWLAASLPTLLLFVGTLYWLKRVN
jgi:lipopolysaccharide export system permease protein